MRVGSFVLALLSVISAVSAANIVVTVGGNTTTNSSLVFQPQRVVAQAGDVVVFNFTQGNHTATQAVFYAPCIPAHEANITINGFDSGFRDSGNFTAVTILTVPIDESNVNTTMWFFDWNTCGKGGVGVINSNESSTQTLAGFERNAIRLNGTGATSSSVSHTATQPGTSATSTSTTSSADRAMTLGGFTALPLVLVALTALVI
ncbi:hypothetical protein JAAARDRAFT_211438 [Jaapia argillacea MUCL 33604]|uniref:Phytocyanin domain-containing protein n=1 Tax=Jaapia argillacea MUCL 33604 TaxID=933084 RepID=A0A067P7H4_9AGAM|nr:hypothetical protein JAAARDRAFT_211438 [Jaapia argillacea MUCL 33604]